MGTRGSLHFILLLFIVAFLGIKAQAFVTPDTQLMTYLGKNRHPIFVSNNSFVFVSKDRKGAKDTQLYFKDMKREKEKQITHQRGLLANGLYVDNEGHVFYTSTTDEEKETPQILRKYLKRFPSAVKNDSFFHEDFSPKEIYQSKIDGSKIKRLTDFSGFDGFPAYLAAKKRLYFSRWHNDRLTLFAKSLDKNLAPWKVNKTAGHDLGLQLSPDEKNFVWYRFSPDFKSSQVVYSDLQFKDTHYLTLENGVNWSPTWHPNGKSVIYSARNAQKNDFDLYEVNIKGECKRQITGFPGDEFYPSISPNGKQILFTSTKSGSEQIYKIAYPGPLECQ